MFTGIIKEIGSLESIQPKGSKKWLKIRCHQITNTLRLGDSICCNGACLTVVDFAKSYILVEVMAETLLKTTIKWWKPGDNINLEPALSANGRFDGHFVQGHVDTILKFNSREQLGDTIYLWYDLPIEYQDMITWQGSIAINGVSLTVAKLEVKRFAVALITHTLANSNLIESLKYVNVEFDIIGKYIVRYLKRQGKPQITEEWLREKGF